MKTVKDACKLQPNALDVRLSDQIEQLDELINMEGTGEAFFERTFITQGMRSLVEEGIARLAGRSSSAIFHLKQAMGGGKTHLLVGFGLLARHPELREKYFGDVSYIHEFQQAKIAAFNGRNSPPEYFWGEIAKQLGKPELFKPFWAAGPKAPDEKDWLALFEVDDPVLILLDEMPPYFHYLNTQKVGDGTVADIATRAFANLLTAAGKKKNVAVVVSDLSVVYYSGRNLINQALKDARRELGRQERSITPVDLAANEVYDILKKRLFKKLPDESVIQEVASAFGKELEQATKAKVAGRAAEAIADEIENTYPFHPRLKNLIALFKENEEFKQTRGLIELVSRLLKSVWERPDNDVFLIGAQHFDLSIPEVRDKLTEISDMRDVISKDLWDANNSAHAQVIDLKTGNDAARQVSTLLFTASLSTAVNAVKGLTREEIVECLVAPLRRPSEFTKAFDELKKVAWYLHHTPEGRYYFDRQENLTKLLQTLAKDAPQNQIDDLIRHRLKEMFDAKRKTAYQEAIPLPRLEDVADKVRRERVLLIVSPDSKIPPEEVKRFFEGTTQKNNLCILTGDKTAMASVKQAARQYYAAQKADARIPKGHAQREDLERKQQDYDHDFTSTILSLFDKVLYPIRRPGKDAQLVAKPLDMSRDTNQPFDGEEQIIKTLTTDPIKLYLDVEENFDALRSKAEDILWPENQDEVRWSDVLDRYKEDPAMPWLPPKGLENLKKLAINRGLWEDLENGYITKRPRKKKTSAQVFVESGPDDSGKVRLRINTQNAGPAPKIYYEEDGHVSEESPRLKDQTLVTNALKVEFLVVDPSGQFETGDPVTWTNKLIIRSNLVEKEGKRFVELFVAPRGKLRYTLDGSEPREGKEYTGEPIPIGDGETLLRVFAEADGLETKEDFTFSDRGQKGIKIDPSKPAKLKPRSRPHSIKLDSRAKTFEALDIASQKSVILKDVVLTIGQGNKVVNITIIELPVDAGFLEGLLKKAMEKFDPDAPVTMSFKSAEFKSGHDLQEFLEKLGLDVSQEDIAQQ